jgi:anti-sigma B factor antagonist
MNPVAGKLSVWTGEQSACIRIAGRANFALSVQFRQLLKHLREAGHTRVLLDLSGCAFMDSTFLGILAFESNSMAARGADGVQPRMELLNAGSSVREIIQDLGISHLVSFAERDLSKTEFKDVPESSQASVTDLTRTCLEAHELLMALHPENVEKFRDVARFFAEELKNSSGNQDKPPK